MSSADIYQPYTYLIGWSKHDRWYYGVRFAKGCNPSDLWVKYFTSSKLVARCRAIYGEPDVIDVRKTFATKTEAIDWEAKVLVRMGVVQQHKWLNCSHARQNHDKIDQTKRDVSTFKTTEFKARQKQNNITRYQSGAVDMSYRQSDAYRHNQSVQTQQKYKQGLKTPTSKDCTSGQFTKRAVSVAGQVYATLSKAASAHGISVKSAYNRVNKDTWPEWFYV